MADEETKVEEVQETAEAPPEVSMEDIKAQLEEARGQVSERDTQIADKDAKLKGLRQSAAKHSERERKLTDTLDSINNRLDLSEEQGASILDILESQNEGT